MLRTFIYIVVAPLDLISLILGICIYRVTKKTPYLSYKSMHRLFYIFGGIVTEFTNNLTKSKKNNTLNYNNKKNNEIIKSINEDGLFIKENFLTSYEIKQIQNMISNSPLYFSTKAVQLSTKSPSFI